MNEEVKTLWLWDTLPEKVVKSEEQTWLKEGDAVENVDRLALGIIVDNNHKSSCKTWITNYQLELNKTIQFFDFS